VRLACAACVRHSFGVQRTPFLASAATSLVLAATLSGCALLAPDRPVVLSSTPPGATVRVDGRTSGFVTPCQIQLDVDEDVRIDFELPGFRGETRWLTPHDEVYTVLWHEMTIGPHTWNFPLFLSRFDVFVPVKWSEGHAPGRIHVDLDRLSDEDAGAAPARAR
jgi:hypothetical protein